MVRSAEIGSRERNHNILQSTRKFLVKWKSNLQIVVKIRLHRHEDDAETDAPCQYRGYIKYSSSAFVSAIPSSSSHLNLSLKLLLTESLSHATTEIEGYDSPLSDQ